MFSKYRFLIFSIFLFVVSTMDSFAQDKVLALKYFMQEENYEGAILLYDYNKDKLYASHVNDSKKRVLPASTYKIFNTLLFLHLGLAKDTTYTIPWDGKEYKHKGKKVPSWYKDTNLAEAFRNSTVWYYKALSNPIDFNTHKVFMKQHKYGKIFGRKRGEVIDFWNHGSKIGISAKDQIKLLVRLHEGKTSFKQEHVDIVKELMVEERNEDYVLRSKTGWTESPEGKFTASVDLGWYIGYVETDDNTYFFAVRIEKPAYEKRDSFASDRKKIAKKALQHQFGIEIK